MVFFILLKTRQSSLANVIDIPSSLNVYILLKMFIVEKSK